MRKTLHLNAANPGDIARAAGLLRGGGLVAFPTETVYGLGANALSAAAVAGIFEAKQRPAWDPVIVHMPDLERLQKIVAMGRALSERVGALAEAFWPGPLTLLLPRTDVVPDTVTAGRPLVGVRVPAHPAALALLRAAALPLGAPSANRFGHTSPTTAAHVLADLEGRIDAVLDAGPCRVGVESTVLDPGPTPMVVYRSGAVTLEAIGQATGLPVKAFAPSGKEQPGAPLPSPGVGLRHYAPEAEVRLCDGSATDLLCAVRAAALEHRRLGVLLPGDWAFPTNGDFGDLVVQPWGRWTEPELLARELFAGMRALEAEGVAMILCPLPQGGDLREALRDRLLKAAKPKE